MGDQKNRYHKKEWEHEEEGIRFFGEVVDGPIVGKHFVVEQSPKNPIQNTSGTGWEAPLRGDDTPEMRWKEFMEKHKDERIRIFKEIKRKS